MINGNYTEALDLYNMAIAADPGYTRAWIDKGNRSVGIEPFCRSDSGI